MSVETFVDLNLYRLGQEKCETGHVDILAREEHFLFCYILSGRGVLNPDDKQDSWNLANGQGFMVFPGQERRLQVKAGLCEYAWLEFGGLRAGGAVKAAGLCPLEAASCQEVREGSRQEIYVRKALGFIEENFQNDISVEDIADTCGLNRSYFGKIFKETMGKTTQEFLLRYRMAGAAELLRQPQYSVGDIGTAVGYQNPLHFSRAFKNTYGISPRKWRNQQRRSS